MRIPDSTKASLGPRLWRHAGEHWPGLADVKVRFRSNFAYMDGEIKDGPTIPLFRLRYGRSASVWGFAIYLPSRDGYEDSVLPTGSFAGSPEEALDCACMLYLADADMWPGWAGGLAQAAAANRSLFVRNGPHCSALPSRPTPVHLAKRSVEVTPPRDPAKGRSSLR